MNRDDQDWILWAVTIGCYIVFITLLWWCNTP